MAEAIALTPEMITSDARLAFRTSPKDSAFFAPPSISLSMSRSSDDVSRSSFCILFSVAVASFRACCHFCVFVSLSPYLAAALPVCSASSFTRSRWVSICFVSTAAVLAFFSSAVVAEVNCDATSFI